MPRGGRKKQHCQWAPGENGRTLGSRENNRREGKAVKPGGISLLNWTSQVITDLTQSRHREDVTAEMKRQGRVNADENHEACTWMNPRSNASSYWAWLLEQRVLKPDRRRVRQRQQVWDPDARDTGCVAEKKAESSRRAMYATTRTCFTAEWKQEGSEPKCQRLLCLILR